MFYSTIRQFSLAHTRLIRLNIIACCILCSSFIGSLEAQVKSDDLAQKAKAFLEQSQYDSAEYYLKMAIRLTKVEAPNNNSLIGAHQLNLSRVYLKQNRFRLAKESISEAQELIGPLPLESKEDYEIHLSYHSVLGNYHRSLGQFDSSIVVNKREKELHEKNPYIDSIAYANTLTNIALAYQNMGDLKTSAQYEKPAFSIKKRLLGPDDYNLVISYKMLGASLIESSYSIAEGLNYMKEAVRITEKKWGRKHPETIAALQLLSSGYEIAGESKKMLKVAEEVIKSTEELGVGLNIYTLQSYSLIAGALSKLGRHEEAIHYYTQFEEFSNNMPEGQKQFIQYVAYGGLGALYKEKGEYELAEKYLTSAFELLNQLRPGDPLLSGLYNQMGYIYMSKKDLEKAMTLTEKAIQVNSHDKSLFQESTVPLSWLAKSPMEFAESHLQKTELLFDLYFNKRDSSFLQEGWQLFDEVEQFLEGGITEQSKITDLNSLQRLNNRLYTAAIETLWKLDSMSSESDYSEALWTYSEKSKALRQLLKERKRQVANMGELPLKILAEEDDINQQIARYKSLMIVQRSPDSIQSKLFDLQKEKEDFEDRIKSQFPEQYELMFSTDRLTLDQVKSKLKPAENIIDYFVSGDYVYASLINQEGISTHRLGLTKTITEQVNQFANALTTDKGRSFGPEAFELYQTILHPLSDQISGDALSIVADKMLWKVNFDLLLTKAPADNPKDHSYLLAKYAISYANSISLRFRQQEASVSRSKVLAFSFGEQDDKDPVVDNFRDAPKDNLPGTAKEIERISSVVQGDYYYGTEANESTFKSIAGEYNILHLALHGEVDDYDPDYSKLHFNQSETESQEDNVLHTFELYNMDLSADLAVLSACNTGIGQLNSGEGILSLGRAFRFAGVKSVVLSQWEVSDATTPMIMDYFYQHLKDGKAKAQALRQAKLDFLESSNNITANPYYWGSFFILGNTDPINLPERNNNNWYLYLILGILLIAAATRRKKSRQHD